MITVLIICITVFACLTLPFLAFAWWWWYTDSGRKAKLKAEWKKQFDEWVNKADKEYDIDLEENEKRALAVIDNLRKEINFRDEHISKLMERLQNLENEKIEKEEKLNEFSEDIEPIEE